MVRTGVMHGEVQNCWAVAKEIQSQNDKNRLPVESVAEK